MKRWSLAVVAVLILSGVGRTDEAAAVKMIEKFRGKIERDNKQPGKPIIGVDLKATMATDAILKELKNLKDLQKLSLRGTKITNAGLKDLKELPQLTTLDVGFTKISDAGLKELKELKELNTLFLFNTKVTAAGVGELKKALPKLEVFGK